MRARAWPLPLALVSLAFAASLLLAGALPLIDPDEGRNAEVAREMSVGGDLVIPHLAGMPYLDKPPAFFWATALAIRLLGPTPLAARLPAALAAALTLLALAHLALRQSGRRLALRAVALLAAAPLFAVLSAYCIFDMPLTLCVTVLWTALARELSEGALPRRRAAMFAAVTLGVLLKGPVMLAWALGGSLAAALLLRRRDPLRWLAWWPGWLMVAGLAGGWFALATARHPEYPHYAFVEETFERLSRGTFHREQPWWFMPAVLIIGTLPWSLATPWRDLRAGASPVRDPASRRMPDAHGVALGFVLFGVVFFTLSHSKLVTYCLPALPPLAWLAAAAWNDPRPHRWPALMLAGLFGALGVACLVGRGGWLQALSQAPASSGVETGRALGLALLGAAMLGLAAAMTRRPGLAFVTTLLFAPIALGTGRPLAAAYAATQSGAPLAHAIAAAGGGPVRYEACYSPGTDYLLGHGGTLVATGDAWITSNYQLRYRAALAARGGWTPLAADAPTPGARVVVRPASSPGDPPAGWTECFHDRRFVAFRADATP